MKNSVIKYNFKNFAFLTIAILLLTGCTQNIVDLKKTEKKAYITIGNKTVRAANPSLSLEKMENFVLKGTYEGNEITLKECNEYKDIQNAIIFIDSGIWDFTLTAKQGGVSCYDKIEKKSIDIGENNLEFNLHMYSMETKGHGNINININDIETEALDQIWITLLKLDNNDREATERGIIGKISDGHYSCAFYKQNINSGTYIVEFSFSLLKPYSLLGKYTEVINITNDCVSNLTIEKLDLAKIYKLNFNYNNETEKAIRYYSCYSEIVLEKPERTDYEFVGWYTNPDFLGEPITVISKGSSGDLDLYAKWKHVIAEYKVRHCRWNWETSAYDESLELYDDYKKGKIGSKTEAIASSNAYFDGFTAKEIEQQVILENGSTIVKIYYDPIPIKISLKLNGGNINGLNSVINIEGNYLNKYTVEDFEKDFKISYCVPSKDGWNFLDWKPYTFTDMTDTLNFNFPRTNTDYTAEYSSVGKFIKFINLSDHKNYCFIINESIGYDPNPIYYPAFGNADTNPVKVSPFYIAETECTYSTWCKVYEWATNEDRGSEKYKFTGEATAGQGEEDYLTGGELQDKENQPVICKLIDAIIWCNAASEMEGLLPYYIISENDNTYSIDINKTSNGYRLPTTVEWEFAARGKNPDTEDWKTAIFAAPDSLHLYYEQLGDYMVICFPYNKIAGTKPVKSKLPNSAGLYDMNGNVFEFCHLNDTYSIEGGYWMDCDPSKIRQHLIIDGDPFIHLGGFRLARSIIIE